MPTRIWSNLDSDGNQAYPKPDNRKIKKTYSGELLIFCQPLSKRKHSVLTKSKNRVAIIGENVWGPKCCPWILQIFQFSNPALEQIHMTTFKQNNTVSKSFRRQQSISTDRKIFSHTSWKYFASFEIECRFSTAYGN